MPEPIVVPDPSADVAPVVAQRRSGRDGSALKSFVAMLPEASSSASNVVALPPPVLVVAKSDRPRTLAQIMAHAAYTLVARAQANDNTLTLVK